MSLFESHYINIQYVYIYKLCLKYPDHHFGSTAFEQRGRRLLLFISSFLLTFLIFIMHVSSHVSLGSNPPPTQQFAFLFPPVFLQTSTSLIAVANRKTLSFCQLWIICRGKEGFILSLKQCIIDFTRSQPKLHFTWPLCWEGFCFLPRTHTKKMFQRNVKRFFYSYSLVQSIIQLSHWLLKSCKEKYSRVGKKTSKETIKHLPQY